MERHWVPAYERTHGRLSNGWWASQPLGMLPPSVIKWADDEGDSNSGL